MSALVESNHKSNDPTTRTAAFWNQDTITATAAAAATVTAAATAANMPTPVSISTNANAATATVTRHTHTHHAKLKSKGKLKSKSKSKSRQFRPKPMSKLKSKLKSKAKLKSNTKGSRILTMTMPKTNTETYDSWSANASAIANAYSSPKRSWRSTGWTPLSYPSNALYQNHDRDDNTRGRLHIHDHEQDHDHDHPPRDMNMNRGVDLCTRRGVDYGHRHHQELELELNPFFPLHRDVILATARELLILDGALDGSTLEVNVNVNKQKHANEDEEKLKQKLQDETQKNDEEEEEAMTKNDTVCASVTASATADVNAKTNHDIQNETHTDADADEAKKSSIPVNVNVKLVGGKRKHAQAMDGDGGNGNGNHGQVGGGNGSASGSSMTLAALQNECPSRVIPPSAEALAEILLQNFAVRDHEHAHEHTHAHAQSHTASASAGAGAGVTEEHQNRVRKVSDADAIMHQHRSGTHMHTNMHVHVHHGLLTRYSTSPHLAVVAINLNNNQGQSEDMERCIEQFVKRHKSKTKNGIHITTNGSGNVNGHAHAHGNDSVSVSVPVPDHKKDDDEETMLLRLKRDGSLPKLLDLSIMMEVHLRQVALAVTRHSFHKYIGEKALREFLGYKSPAQKKDRVVELISDFMFDVSHAMFAWEQTENEMYGNGADKAAMDENRDATICKVLFDRRALRKIGGFEPTSLLYHALSIQRSRQKGEAWTTLAKTQSGRKMFAHHRDNHVKVHVGQMRRDKRMKKNLTTASSYHSMVVEDGEKARSRSCSISSDGTGSTSGETISDSIARIPTVSPVVPNLFPITITREAGKSWGILLAREGSMCVVMRVPDASKSSSSEGSPPQLQRGDLIVSIRNERDECVNTPTHASTHHDSWDASISPEWFKRAVSIFKESNTLHLEVRRAISIA